MYNKNDVKKIIINDSKLQDSQVDMVRLKARAILVDGGKILVANYGGVMLLPGGSIDRGETETQAILRELKEETGIIYEIQDVRKVILLEYYQPKYPTRDGETMNRLIKTYYYLGRYKGIDLNNVQRTEKEKKDNFRLELLGCGELLRQLDSDNNNPRKKYFDREMREVLNTYRELITHEEEKITER